MNPPRHDPCHTASRPHRPSWSYRGSSHSWFGRVWLDPCPYGRWHTSLPLPSSHTSGHTCTSRTSPSECCDRMSPSPGLICRPHLSPSAQRVRGGEFGVFSGLFRGLLFFLGGET